MCIFPTKNGEPRSHELSSPTTLSSDRRTTLLLHFASLSRKCHEVRLRYGLNEAAANQQSGTGPSLERSEVSCRAKVSKWMASLMGKIQTIDKGPYIFTSSKRNPVTLNNFHKSGDWIWKCGNMSTVSCIRRSLHWDTLRISRFLKSQQFIWFNQPMVSFRWSFRVCYRFVVGSLSWLSGAIFSMILGER